jgi:hypothetical protein
MKLNGKMVLVAGVAVLALMAWGAGAAPLAPKPAPIQRDGAAAQAPRLLLVQDTVGGEDGGDAGDGADAGDTGDDGGDGGGDGGDWGTTPVSTPVPTQTPVSTNLRPEMTAAPWMTAASWTMASMSMTRTS